MVDTSRPGISQLLNYCSQSCHSAFSWAVKREEEEGRGGEIWEEEGAAGFKKKNPVVVIKG